MSTLNLFPARVPIGLVQPDGTVLMTPEFVRAMRALFERVGGPDGMGSDDLALLALLGPQPDLEARRDIADLVVNAPVDQVAALAVLTAQINEVRAQATQLEGMRAELAEARKALEDAAVTRADLSGQVAALQSEVDDLRRQAALVETFRAELAEARKALDGVELQATFRDPFRVDWERPGKIGSLTPNTAAFAAGTVSAPSVTLDVDTTTGLYRSAANKWALAVSGAKLIEFSANLVTITAGNLLIGTTTDGMTSGGSLAIAQDLAHRGANFGLFNTAPTSKKTVTGSRAGNAALASLLTQLAAYGLVTDSSTA